MKKWYQSKTIWFNALAGLFLLLEQLTPAMQYLLGAEWMQVYSGAVLAGNIILRFVTTQAITHKKPAN